MIKKYLTQIQCILDVQVWFRRLIQQCDVGLQGAMVTFPYLLALVNVLGGHDIIHQTIGDQGIALSPSITLNPFSCFQITKFIVPQYLAITTEFSPSSSFQCYPLLLLFF